MATKMGLGRNRKPFGAQPEDAVAAFILPAPPQAAAAPPGQPQHLIDLVNHEYYGTEGPDAFVAPTDDDWYLSGQGGNDTLSGAGGDDVIVGGSGSDVLSGGSGSDSFYVDSAGDTIVEGAPQGAFDRVYASVDYTLNAGAHIEILSTDFHGGTAPIALGGNELDNIIYGNAGNNILYGQGGNDFIGGLGGDDSYFIDSAGDYVQEFAGGGSDRIYAGGDYTLYTGQHVEILSTDNNFGTAAIALGGNELDNVIYGNAGANILYGKGGNDFLGGLGGDDSYFVDSAGDYVQEFAAGGADRIHAGGDYTLFAGQHVEILSTDDNFGTAAISLGGNELDNVIYGNAGNNILYGKGGNDFIAGQSGDDSYYIDSAGDYVSEGAGGGNDRIYAGGDYTLYAGQQIEILSTDNNAGTAAIALGGNELANSLYGNAGNNILDGKGGADSLAGFEGDDFYYVDHAGDGVYETAGGGADRVHATVSYQLGAGVSVETLSTDFNAGTAAIDLTGNEIVNSIFGNAGANLLDGKGGSDTLIGGGGADIFAFTTALGAGNVDIVADFAAGTDKIRLAGSPGAAFAVLASETLAARAFVVGSAALDADDYLIYNSATGALLFDADGNGAIAAVQFATLGTGLALTAADFVVSGGANAAPAITSAATPSIPENSAASTIVYQTVASDADGDRITYSLTGTDASLLTIDGSGAVRLISSADFETKSTYSFTVVASDSGLSTSKDITLTITDVADVATPIINEVATPNDGTASAQAIDRNTFTIANNPNLPNDDLPSATIVGSVSSEIDADYFSITLQAGELLILDVDGTLNAMDPDESLDSFVRVFGPNGVEIVSNDDQQSFDQGSVPTIASHNTDSYLQFRASSAGVYYFSIEAFDQLSAGNYRLNVSIGPPATPQQLIEEDVDALISGLEWNHPNLTYGFPTQAGQYPSTFREVNPTTDFHPFSAGQQAATRQLLQLVANVSSLTFAELTGGTDHLSGAGFADLRYGMSTDPEVDVAYAYLPTNGGSSSAGGSSWYNTNSFNAPTRGNYAWMAILHETGHALGLKHGHEAPAIRPERDSTEYTVMTYRSYPGDPLTGGYSNGTYSFPQTLMMYDIAALQEMYGANFAFNSGNTVYSWNPNVGETSINGSSGQAQVGLGSGESSNRVFLTIWDGGGTDTYDLSAYTTATIIDLRPGEWTTTSTVQLANLGDGNFARGNVANALMYQGNTASLIENAVGGSGGDTIIANQAANSLTGGAGPDTFTWKANTDAGVGAAADTITDFLRGGDIIRLTDIDTNPGTGADDAFAFIGTGAFTNAAGQLRYQVEGPNLRVQADFDGNGIADMEIVVMNNTILAASDFFL